MLIDNAEKLSYTYNMINELHKTRKAQEEKTMTNQMIVFMERCRLMDQGVIKGTGRFVEIETDQGVRRLEEPEPIYTYKRWFEHYKFL